MTRVKHKGTNQKIHTEGGDFMHDVIRLHNTHRDAVSRRRTSGLGIRQVKHRERNRDGLVIKDSAAIHQILTRANNRNGSGNDDNRKQRLYL